MHKLLKPLQAVKTKRGYSIFSVVLVALFSLWVFFDATKTEVVFAADGDVQTVKTDTATVGELLDDLDIDVGQYDELSHEKSAKIVDGMEIRFKTANKVLVTIDDKTDEYHTTAVTVGQFLREGNFDFSRYDDISHSNIAILKDEMEIEVKTAFQVLINDGGDEQEVWATEGTVEELLEEEEIEYDKTDHIEPELDEELEEDMEVTVTHIETKTKDIEESIPFHVEEKKDSSLKKGKKRTISEGEKGKLLKTVEITFENGEEVSRDVIDKDVVNDSKNKIVAVGTKEKVSQKSNTTSNSSSSSKSSGKTMTMVATAYGPDCAGCSGISATGMNLKGAPRVIAVDPSVIPLGSKVWVEGYGEAIAADTGGAIKGNRIDVLMASEAKAASQWGRRTVQVKILD